MPAHRDYNAFMLKKQGRRAVSPEEKREPGRCVQLHRALSKLGWGSRSQAWAWIRAGRVEVDGRPVADPLAWVDLDHQRITRAGQDARPGPTLVLALYKPKGVMVTRRDERGRKTVYDLLPPGLPWVFPAGRLDADSEGLLILTNDSALATRLTEPAHRVPKRYHVTVRGIPADKALETVRQGITLADGPTRPAQVRILGRRSGDARLEVILTEGRNRQVRRMFAAIGHRVRRLVRVAIGAYCLRALPAGACVTLNRKEQRLLLQQAKPAR
jgi:23S rRNA pseudouridine2605 synthase